MIYKLLLLAACIIIFTSFTEQNKRVENLYTFARVYGYVKYFHPSDEASNIDWERFAAYGAKRVENAKNETELISILKDIFLPIAPSLIICRESDGTKFDLNSIMPFDTSGFKPIAWQHYGVELYQGSIYKSVRINRKVEHKPDPTTWGSLVNKIDAVPYRGMQFKIEARVKADVAESNGAVHLWLRVDRTSNEAGYFNRISDRPIKINEWRSYSFSGRIDDDAVSINMGVGSG